MCRHLAYLGPPVGLDALLLSPEHSLLRQSHAPRHQSHGRMNADGFGAGWYDHTVRAEPARYRSARPMWSDASFASLARLVRADALLAAVRSASPGMPVEETGAAPFTHGRWLFSHNGLVDDFHGDAGVALRRTLGDRGSAALLGHCDSEVLFALTLARLDAGAEPGEALASVVGDVLAVGPARLNLLLTDGHRIAATACGDTLVARQHPGDAVVVASEPFDDDPGWEPVPDASLVRATPTSVTVTPL